MIKIEVEKLGQKNRMHALFRKSMQSAHVFNAEMTYIMLDAVVKDLVIQDLAIQNMVIQDLADSDLFV